ncbi:hypothetical protein Syun_028835 [Stephania yunnanensis]|uniref:60S ribosome subunit biogenesis protein NIP7 homolog n=1 Tax=Stephania yunnanensis TaxID=152371 RepID=A0AAP0E4F3_9MAGN
MRALDEKETTAVFEKLFKFTGKNLKNIVEKASQEGAEGERAKAGTASGSRRTECTTFHLTVQALGLLAENAKHKVWVKPTSEMSFLYGNHVLKGGVGRITEGVAPGDGVVVFSMSDVPLGFGVAAKGTQECRRLDPNGIVVLHQGDVGEYLRMEDDL